MKCRASLFRMKCWPGWEAAGEASPTAGIEMATALIEAIRPWAQGIYLMPQFNRYDLIAEIIEASKVLDK